MRQSWITVLVVATALIFVGCNSEPPQRPSDQTEVAQEGSPEAGVPQANSAEAEIARWTAIVAQEPTADNWNELSYANLKASQWEAAAKAGQEALKLEYNHAYALYNTGMALLERGRSGEALHYLTRTQALQPTRHEPEAALARAYQNLGHHLLAGYHAHQAVTLSNGDPEAIKVEQSVSAMLTGDPPVDYADACARKLTHGQLFLCLYQEPDPEQVVSSNGSAYPAHRYTLYAAPAGQPVQRIPVGYTEPGDFVVAALPGGATGFWLEGGWVGAGIARTTEWRLFAWDGRALRQILFVGGEYHEGWISDFMRSPYVPPISGELITVSHRDDVTGSRTIQTTRQLSLSKATAIVTGTEEIIWGSLTRVSPDIEVTAAYDYRWSYGLADGVEILLDGKQAVQAELVEGMPAEITVQGGVITKVDARSK